MFLLLLYVMSQNLCKILYLETILSKVCHQTYTNEGGNKYVNLEHFVVNTRFQCLFLLLYVQFAMMLTKLTIVIREEFRFHYLIDCIDNLLLQVMFNVQQVCSYKITNRYNIYYMYCNSKSFMILTLRESSKCKLFICKFKRVLKYFQIEFLH